MKKPMKKTILKVLLVLVLIPVLGFGLPFGGAYIYGRVSHYAMKTKAENRLTSYGQILDDTIGSNIGPTELNELGFASVYKEDGAWLFEFPYDYKKLFSWVPCGLMYCEDTSQIEHWRKTELLKKNWYFYWDT